MEKKANCKASEGIERFTKQVAWSDKLLLVRPSKLPSVSGSNLLCITLRKKAIQLRTKDSNSANLSTATDRDTEASSLLCRHCV